MVIVEYASGRHEGIHTGPKTRVSLELYLGLAAVRCGKHLAIAGCNHAEVEIVAERALYEGAVQGESLVAEHKAAADGESETETAGMTGQYIILHVKVLILKDKTKAISRWRTAMESKVFSIKKIGELNCRAALLLSNHCDLITPQG